MKDRKDNLLNDEEIDDVAGGRASNEYWTCPRCGQIVFCTKHLFYSKIEPDTNDVNKRTEQVMKDGNQKRNGMLRLYRFQFMNKS